MTCQGCQKTVTNFDIFALKHDGNCVCATCMAGSAYAAICVVCDGTGFVTAAKGVPVACRWCRPLTGEQGEML